MGREYCTPLLHSLGRYWFFEWDVVVIAAQSKERVNSSVGALSFRCDRYTPHSRLFLFCEKHDVSTFDLEVGS